MNAAVRPTAQPVDRRGIVFALAAYGLWGIIPAYFKLIAAVPAVDIVAHRVVWSFPFLAVLLTASAGWPAVRAALRRRRSLALLALTAMLIGINWLLYVYAVNSGHVLAASLGYYLNPLANILLGRFALGERLTRRQWMAVALAGAGVAVLAAGALGTLWISLTLCASFASYGLLRKIVAVESLPGLAIETAFLLPAAVAWLTLGGLSLAAADPHPALTRVMLVGTGIVSTVPLLCFTAAARRLPYSLMGMLQFVAPTLQFLLATLVYGEPLTRAHLMAFAAIWGALALYSASLLPRRTPPGPELGEG